MFKVTPVLTVDPESRGCAVLPDRPVLAGQRVSLETPESEVLPEHKAVLDPLEPPGREAHLGQPDSQPRMEWPVNVDPMDEPENGKVTLESV